MEAATPHIPDRVQRTLSVAAANSLVVVLLHPTVLWLFNARHDTASLGVYALVLILPTLLALVLARVPAAAPLGQASWERVLLGVRRALRLGAPRPEGPTPLSIPDRLAS